jgi:hypothetical protein
LGDSLGFVALADTGQFEFPLDRGGDVLDYCREG